MLKVESVPVARRWWIEHEPAGKTWRSGRRSSTEANANEPKMTNARRQREADALRGRFKPMSGAAGP